MECPNCHQPVEPGATFCGNCGQQLVAAPTQAPSAAPPYQTPVSNPQAMPPTPSASFGVAPAAMATAPPPQPVFAGSQPVYAGLPGQNVGVGVPHQKGETKAVVGLILSIMSIPGAFIPILGLVLGIAGVVIASMSMHVKRMVAILSFIFACLGIIASIALWVYNYQHVMKSAKLSADLQTVTTSCYTAKFSKSLYVTKDSDCGLHATDSQVQGASTISYVVNGLSDPAVNSGNFMDTAQRSASVFVDSLSKSSGTTFKVASQHSATFAGEPAYLIDVTNNTGGRGEDALIYHSSANGDNLFNVAVFSRDANTGTLSTLEPNFTWK